MLASTNATVEPLETTSAVQVRMAPGCTGARKLIFISALAEKTWRPLTDVTVAAPMDESANAARNPPCMVPAGLAKRSSAVICQTQRPGTDLSMQTMPSVRSLLGGTCSR
jgi:hypothetical protein